MDSCEHNADFECFWCTDRRHQREHPYGDQPGCMTCKLRSIQISPAALAVRKEMRLAGELANPAPKRQPDSFDRGIVTDARGMPLLTESGEPMPMGRYRRNRRRYEERRKVLATHPDPFGAKTPER